MFRLASRSASAAVAAGGVYASSLSHAAPAESAKAGTGSPACKPLIREFACELPLPPVRRDCQIVAQMTFQAAPREVSPTFGFRTLASSNVLKTNSHPRAVCGPSGAGKSTLIARLQKEFPGEFGFSVSHTTRKPRAGERDGEHYHFVDKPAMEAEITKGKFLEHANVHGNLYGTSFAAVTDVAKKSVICILDIDVQGVKSCRALHFDGVYVFVAPPSVAELERRLIKRGTETPEKIRVRVDDAAGELTESRAMEWDAYLVNDDLEAAYAKLKATIAETRAACTAYRHSHKLS